MGAAAMALLLASVIAACFVVPGPVIRTSATVGERVAFATVDGRQVVVVAYEDYGPRMPLPPRGSGVMAIDLATGATVWDEELPDFAPGPQVIAAGDTYAYVQHAWGLVIVALEDGSVVAADEEIDGLGDEVPQGRWDNYVYDPRREAILFITEEGEVEQIPLDETAAAGVDQATHDTWWCQLGFEGGALPVTFDVTREVAEGGAVGLAPPDGAPAGLPIRRLYARGDGGGRRELAPADFYAAGLVQEVVPALPPERSCAGAEWPYRVLDHGEESRATTAGLSAGHVVVQSAIGPNDDDQLLTVVDVESGEITATVEAAGGFHAAATAPSGQVVILAEGRWNGPFGTPGGPSPTDLVVIVAEDGTTHELMVAEKGWFGL
ncbi:hypothetical protein DY240_08140 [Jiangella rhizosphaerae]|uniref:Uncharacterized protein n=1 Tax=Jiangella rhizosphaerae TaxID=2293569 RepID=A0A418KT66_9ACTN|nr:hypothetical protein DY240_08140 [Jiangella rhizosphaerae]